MLGCGSEPSKPFLFWGLNIDILSWLPELLNPPPFLVHPAPDLILNFLPSLLAHPFGLPLASPPFSAPRAEGLLVSSPLFSASPLLNLDGRPPGGISLSSG